MTYMIVSAEAPKALLGLQWMFASLSILLVGTVALTALLFLRHKKHLLANAVSALEILGESNPSEVRAEAFETLRAISMGDLTVEPKLFHRVRELRGIVDLKPD